MTYTKVSGSAARTPSAARLGKPVEFPCLVFMQRVNGKPPVRPWRPRGAILIHVNVIGRRKFWRMGGTTGTAIAAVAGTVPAAGRAIPLAVRGSAIAGHVTPAPAVARAPVTRVLVPVAVVPRGPMPAGPYPWPRPVGPVPVGWAALALSAVTGAGAVPVRAVSRGLVAARVAAGRGAAAAASLG